MGFFNGPSISPSEKGAPNGVAPLDEHALVPLVNLPGITITDTFVVNDEASMLLLDAETGDVAVRTDESRSYILAGADPTVLGDWQELLTPGPDGVIVESDFVDPYSYIGAAPAGFTTGDPVWNITRIEMDTGFPVTTATGVEWDDRLTASYS